MQHIKATTQQEAFYASRHSSNIYLRAMLFGLFFFALSLLQVQPAAAQRTQSVGLSKNWAAFCFGSDCWIASSAREDATIQLMATFKNGRVDQITVSSEARPFRNSEKVSIEIEDKEFPMVVDGVWAYLAATNRNNEAYAHMLAAIEGQDSVLRVGDKNYSFSMNGMGGAATLATKRAGEIFRPSSIVSVAPFWGGPDDSLIDSASRSTSLDVNSAEKDSWASSPSVQQFLQVIRSRPPTLTEPQCKSVHEITPSKFRRILFEDTLVITFDGNRFTRNLITESMIETGKIYLCDGGDPLFLIGNEPIYAVEKINPPSEVLRTIDAPLYPADARLIPIDGQNCEIKGGHPEALSAVWSGSCLNKVPVGEGIIQWKKGEETTWRTRVGAEWGVILDDGIPSLALDLNDYRFLIDSCGQDRSQSERLMRIVPPSDIPHEFFENEVVANKILSAAANAIDKLCPKTQRNSNASVAVLRTGSASSGAPMLKATSRGSVPISWTNIENPANKSLFSSIKENERSRREMEKRHEDEQRRIAIEQRAADAAARYQQALNGRHLSVRRQGERFISERIGNLAGFSAAVVMNEVATLGVMERDFRLVFPAVSSGVQTVGEGRERLYVVTFSIADPFVHAERQLLQEMGNTGLEGFNRQVQLATGGSISITCYFSSVDKIPTVQREVVATLVSFRSNGNQRAVNLACR